VVVLLKGWQNICQCSGTEAYWWAIQDLIGCHRLASGGLVLAVLMQDEALGVA
jgi:hypothetical protein